MTVWQASRGSRKSFERGFLKPTINCCLCTSYGQRERNRQSLDHRSVPQRLLLDHRFSALRSFHPVAPKPIRSGLLQPDADDVGIAFPVDGVHHDGPQMPKLQGPKIRDGLEAQAS
jgi:hypothetical protein